MIIVLLMNVIAHCGRSCCDLTEDKLACNDSAKSIESLNVFFSGQIANALGLTAFGNKKCCLS